MAPEGPYRYRSFNMLPVEETEPRRADRKAARGDVCGRDGGRGERGGGGGEQQRRGNKCRFLDEELGVRRRMMRRVGVVVADGL